MIKELVKYGMIAGVCYGLYYLFMMFPLESIIIGGIILMSIVIYWINKTI